MTKPLFSVIVPTYNQAHLLNEALDSIIGQTFVDWEAVVVNDGSTDNTAEVMDQYAKHDVRIKCFHKENGGTGSAINYGIEKAKGEWICWLSSDDLYEPDKFEIQFEAIKQNPHIKFFYTHFYYLNDETKEKGTPDLWVAIPPREFQVTQFLIGNYVNAQSVACHHSVFKKVGVFNTTLRQAQDYDMWLRITSKFESMFINKRTCVTRFHPGQDTNIFVDGMYYDSARSAIEFLNKVKFQEIYPLLDFKNDQHVSVAIDNAIKTTLYFGSFMYRCGYLPILIEKLNEWISNDCPPRLRDTIRGKIREIIEQNKPQAFPSEIKQAYERLISNKKFEYKPYDFYESTLKYIDKLLAEGDQKISKNLERYIHILFTKRETKQLSYVLKHQSYNPKIYDYPKNNEYIKVPYTNLLSWKIEPLTYEGKFKHSIKIKCSKCGESFLYIDTLQVEPEKQFFQIICHSCHTGFELVDSEIHEYLNEKNKLAVAKERVKEKIKVAFITRGIHGKSGGTKIYAKYMQWLSDAGVNLKVVSDKPKGTWFDPPGEFVQVNDFDEADLSDVDFAFLYCILDLPKIADKIPFDRIIYVCQAYEGYLYGRDFEHLRSDKSMFASLHSLPINIISVSSHLQNFFIEKKNKKTYLVRNFIDNSVFKPEPAVAKIKNSILFVGNPFQQLKGFYFVLAAIKAIQQKFTGDNKIKLYVATGIATKQMKNDFDKIKSVVDADVLFFDALSDVKVAELINSCEVYVCGSWYEGFSLSVLEAMACGVNVITTRNYGAESFCQDGVNGFLVDYGDTQKLSDYIYSILSGSEVYAEIRKNAVIAAIDFTEKNTHNVFIETCKDILGLELTSYEYNVREADHGDVNEPLMLDEEKNITFKNARKLEITYLISNIVAVTGGNQTLLVQANEMVKRGHYVTIVTHSERPYWLRLLADVRTAPKAVPLSSYIPTSDVVISTYIDNATELKSVDAPLKVYFHQGDQYIFNDALLSEVGKREQYISNSQKVFENPEIKLISNSHALAREIKSKFNRESDEIVHVGVDSKIFRPLQKKFIGSKVRILVVGPDKNGTKIEPLTFKGIQDIKDALKIFEKINPDFTVVRISNSEPEIFKDYSCEFYFTPNDELKTYLYGTADVLLYASHYESWGLPPLEAMSSGVPVITTANIGSLEYCVNEENCLLVPIKSPTAIADALAKLFNDEELYKKLIVGGIYTAQKYSKVNEWDKYEHTLYKWLSEKIDVFKVDKSKYDIDEQAEKILLLANSLLEKGEFKKCFEGLSSVFAYIEQTDKTDLKSTLYQIYGLSALYLELNSEARSSFEKLLTINHASMIACWGLGQVFTKENEYDNAKVMFEWAVKNDPNNQTAIESLAEINALLGFEATHNTLLTEV